MSTRCNPVEDIDILRNTWSTWLDPTQNPPEKRPWGSKALINACKDYHHIAVFSKRTAVRREVYDRLAARWNAFGLPGEPPQLTTFQQDTQARALHEAVEFGRALKADTATEPGGQPTM
jgi:hypothetical protein